MQPGTSINGRYQIIDPIAQGGGGAVWRAQDRTLDRTVAIKFHRLRPGSEETLMERRKRFSLEAGIGGRIDRQCVPAVLDYGDHDGQPYIVMEYIEGTTLQEFIQQNHPLAIATSAAVAAQLCNAVGVVHALDIVHRDLKPLNIMVTVDGIVKLIDFGIATVPTADGIRLTADDRMLGTSAYMSPEQIKMIPVDSRSDIYVLGLIMFELFSGQPPFPHLDGSIHHDHVHSTPLFPALADRDVPDPLKEVTLRMLAKDRNDRPADVEQVYEVLAQFLPLPLSPHIGRVTNPDPTLPFRRPFAPPASYRPPRRSTGVAGDRKPRRIRMSFPTRQGVNLARQAARDLIADDRRDEAVDTLARILHESGPALGRRDDLVIETRFDYAHALVAAGQHPEALTTYLELQEDARTAYPGDSSLVRRAAEGVATCRIALSDNQTALHEVQATIRTQGAHAGPRRPELFELRLLELHLLLLLGQVDDAAESSALLLDDTERQHGPDSAELHRLRAKFKEKR